MRRLGSFVRQSSAGWLARGLWAKTPLGVRCRWRLLVALVAVALVALVLFLFHKPWPTRVGDPWEQAIIVFMAVVFLLYVALMAAFRRDWSWSAVGIFCVMVGELFLWGFFALLMRMEWDTATSNLWSNILLRAGFVVGGAILTIEALFWAKEQDGAARLIAWLRTRRQREREGRTS